MLNRQLENIEIQNNLLKDNYSKLEELYEIQVTEARNAKEETKITKRYNIAMMIVSVVAMLAAIVSPIITIIFSQGI